MNESNNTILVIAFIAVSANGNPYLAHQFTSAIFGWRKRCFPGTHQDF